MSTLLAKFYKFNIYLCCDILLYNTIIKLVVIITDIVTPEKRSYIMSRIHKKDTSIEMIVRRWLHFFGYRYRVNDKRYPGTPDIVLPKYKTIIFVNGCFWHHHQPNCEISRIPKTNSDFWKAKFERNIKRDKEKFNTLEIMGWNVIIVWECDLNYNKDERLIKLLNEIKSIYNS
jgi:DNA mismatch endonuclease (patch repair protein)